MSTTGLVSLDVVASGLESLDVRSGTFGLAAASRSTDPDSVASEYKHIAGNDQHIPVGVLAGCEDIVLAATAHSAEPVRALV